MNFINYINIIDNLLFAIYLISLTGITLFCGMQFHLLWYYLQTGKPKNPEPLPTRALPQVTVQLPVYNEQYVVERLIDCIAGLDYPQDKLFIQVLDDSTDETAELARSRVAHWAAQGFSIDWIHRDDRSGYKAGALQAATAAARGDLIAIFDADFLPGADFLLKTIPYFENPEVGAVQVRWEHLNESYSLLTRLQAMQLNVHFTIEQAGRQAGNCFRQFNGTAGIWRRQAMEAAGGWHADTLTEDLDLSYRAQLKGWKIAYLEHYAAPAELPVEMNGLKSQQYRWMKGGAENARKWLPAIWQAKLPFYVKMHASAQLLSSGVFVMVLLCGLSSIPLIPAMREQTWNLRGFAFFLSGLLAVAVIYFTANVMPHERKTGILRRGFRFLCLFPVFLTMSMGLSLHNSVAVLEGYAGIRTPFVRTPKYNIRSGKDSFRRRAYLSHRLPWTTVVEGLLSLLFACAVAWGFALEEYAFVVFHAMLSLGFGSICGYSIRHLRGKSV